MKWRRNCKTPFCTKKCSLPGKQQVVNLILIVVIFVSPIFQPQLAFLDLCLWLLTSFSLFVRFPDFYSCNYNKIGQDVELQIFSHHLPICWLGIQRTIVIFGGLTNIRISGDCVLSPFHDFASCGRDVQRRHT